MCVALSINPLKPEGLQGRPIKPNYLLRTKNKGPALQRLEPKRDSLKSSAQIPTSNLKEHVI